MEWRVFDQMLSEARARFRDLSPEAFESLIDEAVTAMRQGKVGETG